MKIEHENVMKIADIHCSSLSAEFIAFASKQQPTYRDQVLEEHLYSVEDIMEEESSRYEPYTPAISETLESIKALLLELDCAYFPYCLYLNYFNANHDNKHRKCHCR